MVVRVSFSMPGDKAAQLERDFQTLVKEVRNPFALGVGKAIAADFLTIEAEQFASEGSRGGKAWAPLKKRTVKVRGSKHPIMRVTGRLEAALASRSGAHKEVLRGDSIELGVKADAFPYAIYHQTGTRGLRGSRSQSESTRGMPLRPLVELSEKDKTKWTRIIARGLFRQASDIAGGA